MTLGSRIKQRRKELKLTQSQLAIKIGKKPRTVQDYEADKATPPLGVVDKIALALDINPFELVYGDNNPMKGFEKLKESIENTKEQLNITSQHIQTVLNALDKHNIKYEVVEYTEHDKTPLAYRIHLNNIDFILDVDDLIDVYNKAQNSFDSSVISIISTIGTYKKQGD